MSQFTSSKLTGNYRGRQATHMAVGVIKTAFVPDVGGAIVEFGDGERLYRLALSVEDTDRLRREFNMMGARRPRSRL